MEVLEYIKQAFELKSQECYKQAIEMLYKALEIESDNTEIFFQLGELYYLLKNFQRAEQYLEKVLAKNENHTEALEILEKIYSLSGETSSAFAIAERLYKIQQNKKNLIKLIKISSQKGNLSKIKEFENTDNDAVLYEIAKAYYDNKDPQTALQKLQSALKINPENENSLVLLGKIYFDKGEFEKSRKIFEKFPKTSANPEILNYLGPFALENMNFLDAIKYFSKASNIDKNTAKYFYNLANAYFYNGWQKEAAANYLKAIQMEPENYGFRYSLAYLYFVNKYFEKAQNEINYILENDENYPPAHVLNALLKFENKDYLGAKNELETNLKSGNDDNFTLVSLAKVYAELSMFEKAEDAIKQAISKNPESLNYKCELAEILTAEKKFDDALKLIEEILKIDENYIQACVIGAKASFESENFDRAKDFAQRAIALDMNFAGGYYYLALVRFYEKDFDEAIECMKRAITFDADNAEYYAKMGEIYEAKEDLKTAIEYFKEAENISGNTEYKLACQRISTELRKSK